MALGPFALGPVAFGYLTLYKCGIRSDRSCICGSRSRPLGPLRLDPAALVPFDLSHPALDPSSIGPLGPVTRSSAPRPSATGHSSP